MVFGITNNSAASQFYHSLISGCKAHKVWHWWLFQNYQKGLENKLHFIPLRICQDDGDVKQCWSKQSPVSWNTWWESNCSCIYNWSAFLEQYFTRVLNIKRYHHFRFSKDEPGKVYFKEFNWSAEQSLMLLKNCAELSWRIKSRTKAVSLQGKNLERRILLHQHHKLALSLWID